MAHFFVASLVCSRAVLFIQLGRKHRSHPRLAEAFGEEQVELHPYAEVLKKTYAGIN